jgi:hypothetical protein
VGLKWPEHEIDHSLLPSAKIKNQWSCTSAPPICRHIIDGENIIIIIIIIYLFNCKWAVARWHIYINVK